MFLKKFKKGMEVGAKSGLRSTQKKVMRSLEKQEKKLWKDINVTQNKSGQQITDNKNQIIERKRIMTNEE